MTDVLSVLIWVQTVCKGYQKTTNVVVSKEKVNYNLNANSMSPDQTAPIEAFNLCFDAFLWKVSLKILNLGIILKTFTHAQYRKMKT